MVREFYKDPIYNLKAVVERTGVSPDALRAWERRYGLPEPGRTEAGHRVYSRRDIDIIKWLVARQDEGLRIGRAVKLWRSLQAEGQDPLQSMPLPSDTRRESSVAGDAIAELQEAWLASSLSFDERGAERALTRAFAKYPPEVVCSEIIASGIARIGELWCEGKATPHQEHFASQLAVRRLETLIAGTPSPTRRGRILTASPSGEEHTIGLLTMTLLLRRAGWDVVYLGPDVPLAQMEQTIEATGPDLVVLGAQQLDTAAAALAMARSAQDQDVPAAFGGRAFDRELVLRRRIPGHYLGSTFGDAVRMADRLMTMPRRAVEVEPVPQAYKEARAHFRDRRLALESDVWAAMRAEACDQGTLRDLNQIVGRAIDAALTFGSMDLAGSQLDWLQGLDECHRPPSQRIVPYLRAYDRAAEKHLDERGALIVAWLAERIGKALGADEVLSGSGGDADEEVLRERRLVDLS
ncbi:MAG: cobalamin-dependent protein [Anaerolineae bacterium]|jgi:DNA-binding transcriptional MerR regulator